MTCAGVGPVSEGSVIADGPCEGRLELRFDIVVHVDGFGDTNLRSSVSDVADPPRYRVVQGRGNEWPDEVPSLSGDKTEVMIRPFDLEETKQYLESRKVEGLREVLEALVREKPYLTGRTPKAGSPGGGTPRSGGARDDDSLGGRIRKQFRKRLPSGLAVPGGNLGDLRIT